MHCGFTEKTIDEFTYLFYKDCINELALKLNYDAVVNILGNAFAGDAGDMVIDANPLYADATRSHKVAHKVTVNTLRQIGLV